MKKSHNLLNHIKNFVSFILKEWVMFIAIVMSVILLKYIIFDIHNDKFAKIAPVAIIVILTLYIGTKINSSKTEYDEIEYVSDDGEKIYKVGDTFFTQNTKIEILDNILNYKLEKNEKEVMNIDSQNRAIKVKFKITNITDFHTFIGAFSCYVDNIKNDNASLNSANYDDDILPGRSSIVYVIYIIPKNAKSIELEYNPLYVESERIIIKLK